MNILALVVALSSLVATGAGAGRPHLESSAPKPEQSQESSDVRPALPGLPDISVLTYNVRGLPWPIAKGRKAALASIGEELAALRREGRAPGIVLIQEGFGDLGPLVRASGYRYWASGPDRGDHPPGPPAPGFPRVRFPARGEGWGKFANSGLHVLSDYPIVRVERAAYRACAGWDCLANKGAMLVAVAAPGMPGEIEVVNTHMNSKGAAKVPRSRSLRAHQLQSDELARFIAKARTPGAPLLVGGDFNVRNAPERYYYRAEQRPFVVVTEYCKAERGACGGDDALAGPEPWLATQDLHAFSPEGEVAVRPARLGRLFAGEGGGGPRLSDHDGLLVQYRFQRIDAAVRRVADLR